MPSGKLCKRIKQSHFSWKCIKFKESWNKQQARGRSTFWDIITKVQGPSLHFFKWSKTPPYFILPNVLLPFSQQNCKKYLQQRAFVSVLCFFGFHFCLDKHWGKMCFQVCFCSPNVTRRIKSSAMLNGTQEGKVKILEQAGFYPVMPTKPW